MRMNPGIILGIEPVNAMNALSQGAQTANAINTVQENNALAPFRRQQAELGVQQGQANLELTRERLTQIRQQSKMAAQEAARQGKAQQMAADLAREQGIVARAMAAYDQGGQEAADAIYMSDPETAEYRGQDPRIIGAGMIGMTEGLNEAQEFMKAAQPEGPEYGFNDGYFYDKNNPQAGAQRMPGLPEEQPTPQSAVAKLRADLGAGLITQDDFERELQRMAPRGMRLDVGPDGTISFVEGAADEVSQKPLTEAQSKDNVYAVRARGALEQLESGDPGALTSRRDRVLEGVPMGIGRDAQSQEFQVAKQAGDEFLQAILRKDTGAAITEPEQELYGVTYLPQPGDGPAVLAAKKASRQRAVAALESGMSEAQIEQITRAEKVLIDSIGKTNAESGPQPGTVEDGYRFKGGDPADASNWERAD